MRWVLIFITLFLSGPVLAQSPEVMVKTELSAETATVGQPLVLRITVLVPTWMPEPPRFPSLEMPNVIVRLPSRASSPVSERVNGETWSGVSRAYRLYPMIPGAFSLPPQPVGITYAAPDSLSPVTVEMALEPIVFTAEVPDAAKGLNPLILAEGFSLSQELEGAESPLKQGDAVTRTVSAKISGTSALFIPLLTPEMTGEAARAYTKDPVVNEAEDRGVLSGSRQETVTYVAQYGGTLELPEVSLEWYNTKTESVEVATLEGYTFSVDAPPPSQDPAFSRRQVIGLTGVVVAVLLALFAVTRYLVPPIKRRLRKNRLIWENSEAYAAKQVQRAIGSHDLSKVYRALALWSAKCPGQIGRDLEGALAMVGASFFREAHEASDGWAALSATFQEDRDRRLKATTLSDLSPLNPP